MNKFIILLAFLCAVLCPIISQAQEPNKQAVTVPVTDEQIVEKRAREVGRSLRCVVCQNQSIDESDATLAQDMRKLVRQQIRAGKSNAQVVAYMQDRYGDFVTYDPPMNASTWFLWFSPLVVFLLGAVVLFFNIRKKHHE